MDEDRRLDWAPLAQSPAKMDGWRARVRLRAASSTRRWRARASASAVEWRNRMSGCGAKDEGVKVLDRQQGAERRTISNILGAGDDSLGF